MLETERLILRSWRPSDRPPFAALNADPEVMRYFPETLSTAASDALSHRIQARIDEHGWGLWAVERRDTSEFIGFVGLAIPNFTAPFTPAVEVGWRLARSAWGQGFATEAARASLAHGFAELGLTEIVSFTSVLNARSRAVMERLGMTRDPADDFESPGVPVGHELRPHVLYRLAAPQ